MRFKPHYNRALGKMIHTKDDYLKEMKRQGVCPADSPDAVAKKYPRREYKPSAWAHDMVRAIEKSTDKDGNVHLGSVARDQLNAKLRAVPEDLAKLKDKLKGGFYGT